jgi:hypothetical protein
MLTRWLSERSGWYTQTIEGPRDVQIEQLFYDLKPVLETGLIPKTWPEFLEILALQKRGWTLCIDEVPYLTASDSSLPSQLQKWIDHRLPKRSLLILTGSSTRMMHDLLLHRASPLYGRATQLLQVLPMDYGAFCRACSQDPASMESFEKFACVGGVPKYWELLEPGQDPVAAAESLYFDFAPYMEQEPLRILRDEDVTGPNGLAVLEAIGRGAQRPSEIASRLGTAQTNLSRLFQQLLDASILTRELPFGESVRSTKKSLYRIHDPAMRFWFRTYLPHQTLWRTYALENKRALIRNHAATVFEDYWRAQIPGAQRYWEGNAEFDLVAPDPENRGVLLVAEVKWRTLTAAEKKQVLRHLESRWPRTSLGRKHPRARFIVLDAGALKVSPPLVIK